MSPKAAGEADLDAGSREYYQPTATSATAHTR
jgi:hypothetical protein